VSPFIKEGTILRPPATIPYDHTSVIATLRKRFPELGQPLTERDAVAPDVSGVLNLESPSNLGPEWIDALPYAASPAAVAQTQAQPLNSMQHGLVDLAANLPAGAKDADPQSIAVHTAALQIQQRAAPIAAKATVRTAAAYIKSQLEQFFRTA
jgi:phospholipase C